MTDPTTETTLRDRIAAALAREDAHNAGYDHGFAATYGADDETDGFVDAVLSATTDQTAAERIEQAEADAELHARNTLAVARERGTYRKVWKEEQERRVKAEAAVARVRRLHDALDEETALTSPDDEITRGAAARKIAAALDGWTDPAVLRRRADETPAAETEAHEPLNQWRVEILDGDEWMPASRLHRDRSLAADQLRMASERRPLWNDGTKVQRRLVRETTTCTVEQPAAGARQDGAQQPGLRERHRAAWNALTPQQQATRLAELDQDDEPQDGAQPS